MEEKMSFYINFISNTFIIITGIVVLIVMGMFAVMTIIDKTQTKHTLRRNFPLIGRLRWVFEKWGEFFRYYMVSNDREERPFSRHQRTYVYRSSKGNKRTEAFGSTLDDLDNDFTIVHSQFPHIKQVSKPTSIIFGEDTDNPYETNSRLNVSGMSFGALSKEAILALSMGMKEAGGWLNTGEGGVSKYHRKGGADLVFQIGTAKINVANDDLTLDTDKLADISADPQIKMIELKLSQGAKPGKGGILPSSKVNAEIAETRGIKIGEASFSPNRHVEADDLEGLLQLIYKTKKHSRKPTGIKMCLGSPEQLDVILNGIKEKINNPDIIDSHNFIPSFITIDSSDGGTGAAPVGFMDRIGMNIRESLPILVQKLNQYELKGKIKIIASGKLVTPAKTAWAFAMGADVAVTARGFLFAQGCIQARQCNRNKCPTGITSHKKKFTKGLNPEVKYLRVAKYHNNLTADLIDIANACGVESFELLNKSHIRMRKAIDIVNI